MLLTILAAGLGSRFGADKQLVPIHKDIILMDYAIYDALENGFTGVVLIIRSAMEPILREHLHKVFPGTQFSFVHQDTLTPAALQRKKPWGTGHAMLCLKDVVQEPFLIINADDFYGRNPFAHMAQVLSQAHPQRIFSAGYSLGNTLSPNGTVSRGICHVDAQNHLIDIQEYTKLAPLSATEVKDERTGSIFPMDTPVSMNFWGFSPEIFSLAEPLFEQFLQENASSEKAEFYIPTIVSHAQAQGYTVEVIPTPEKWFGMTYQEDLPLVQQSIASLEGYPF